MASQSSSLDVNVGSTSGRSPYPHDDNRQNSQEEHVSLRPDRINMARQLTGGREHAANRLVDLGTGEGSGRNNRASYNGHNNNHYHDQHGCDDHRSRSRAAIAQFDQAFTGQP